MLSKFKSSLLNALNEKKCDIGDETHYPINTLQLIELILDHMIENKNSLKKFQPNSSENLKKLLPYIHHTACPRCRNHTETIKDMAGRVRCAHIEIEKFDPCFVETTKRFDNLAQLEKIEYKEIPHKNLPYEPTLEVVNICYAIISERESSLPLEEILNRLNNLRKPKTVFCVVGAGGHYKLREYEDIFYEKSECRVNKNGECEGHLVYPYNTVHKINSENLVEIIQAWYAQDRKIVLNRGSQKHQFTEEQLLEKADGKDPFFTIKQQVKILQESGIPVSLFFD